jgi:hypothetical protein
MVERALRSTLGDGSRFSNHFVFPWKDKADEMKGEAEGWRAGAVKAVAATGRGKPLKARIP